MNLANEVPLADGSRLILFWLGWAVLFLLTSLVVYIWLLAVGKLTTQEEIPMAIPVEEEPPEVIPLEPTSWNMPLALPLPMEHKPLRPVSKNSTLVEPLTLDDLRRHCADVEADPVTLTREGVCYGLPLDERR